MEIFLDDSLKLFRVEHDAFLILIRVRDIDDPNQILMILFDGFAAFALDLTLAELIMTSSHFLEIDAQYSSSCACNLEFSQPLVPFKVDLYVLRQVESYLLTFFIDKHIVVEDRLVRKIPIVLVLKVVYQLTLSEFFFATLAEFAFEED